MKRALVLAGGGAKGAYQAGCIKALRELGFDFDIVTGTSIGALNGLLVVQQDYDALYNLWDKITISDVLKDPINLDFSFEAMISQTNLIKPFFKSYLNEKGADISPLKNMLYALYDNKKTFSSNIDYGIVTVKYPKLTPLEITKKEMLDNEPIKYAIASASCFPAFPVHHIGKQGYIDGGYYDNLPISLALKMGAKKIIAIELNKDATHEHFVSREYITLIRPSYDLGGFLDFDRHTLNWRIKLGYYDTLKTFNKLMGHHYIFNVFTVDEIKLNKFYWLIINYEDAINHGLVNKAINNSKTPLTDILRKDTYLKDLKLIDYFIRAIEIAMTYYHYQNDLIYDFNQVCLEIQKNFCNDYHQRFDLFTKLFLDTPKKELLSTIKKLNSSDAICLFYHSLITKNTIEPNIINNLFSTEYIIALIIYSLN